MSDFSKTGEGVKKLKIKTMQERMFKFDADGAGGAGGAEGAGEVSPPKGEAGSAFNLDGYDLESGVKEALAKDPTLAKFAASLLDAKKSANAEAKKYRQEVEKAQLRETESQKKALEEQGKYKELYENAEKEKADLLAKISQQLLDFKVNEAAAAEGILKKEYLKLLDVSSLKRDEAGNPVGLKELIQDFKKSNPELFKNDAPPVSTPTSRATFAGGSSTSLIENARKSPTVQNIAMALPELLKKR
jgi:hypothetical protein